MSKFTNPSKSKHDHVQREVAEFNATQGKTMIDFVVSRALKAGENRLSEIAKRYRLTPEQIKNSISASLFSVSHDTIRLV